MPNKRSGSTRSIVFALFECMVSYVPVWNHNESRFKRVYLFKYLILVFFFQKQFWPKELLNSMDLVESPAQIKKQTNYKPIESKL